jgi:hypothetical protein
MEAEGDPTVFNLSLKILKSKSAPMMKLIKYNPGKHINTMMFMATSPARKGEEYTSPEITLPGTVENIYISNPGDEETGVGILKSSGISAVFAPVTMAGLKVDTETNTVISSSSYVTRVNPNAIYFYNNTNNTDEPDTPITPEEPENPIEAWR